MQKQIDDLVDLLYRRNFSASQIAFVLGLLASESPEGSPRQTAYLRAQQEMLAC